MTLLAVEQLHAAVGDHEILRGVDLHVGAGQVHAVMGPNGSGKSTLAHVLAGRDPYRATSGRVSLGGSDLLAMAPEARAAAGLFLALQHPVEIPGVQNLSFLRTACNAVRQARGQEPLDTGAFVRLVEERARLVEMERSFLRRSVNEGFSGGEKKRNEILQLAVLEPRLAVLDETDSGLDVDALRVVAAGVNALRSPDRSWIVITHHPQLLDLLRPDRVHVMAAGRIVRSGDAALAAMVEGSGYGFLRSPGADHPDAADGPMVPSGRAAG